MPVATTSPASLNAYLAIREMVEQGLYEKAAARARALRGITSHDWNTLRILISARVAIKTLGKVGEDVYSALDPAQTRDPFLRGELHFARGLHHFHQGDFSSGAAEFSEGQRAYHASKNLERELLCAYNVYSGSVNAGTLSDPVECLAELRDLERLASIAKNKKILGIVFREKSDHLQSLGKLLAAAESAAQSVRLLELHGAKSDYHLALIQAADVECDQGRQALALTLVDRIVPPVDQRVEFALQMIKARLELLPCPALPEFCVASDRRKWLRTFGDISTTTIPVITWNLKNQILALGEEINKETRPIKIKDSSLEGKLLKTLASGPMSKSRLAESLWPEHCGKAHLDNRLHRLLSRFNHKTSGLVKFDGHRYHLQRKIVVKTE